MSNALSDVSFWFDSIGDLPPVDIAPLPDRLDVAIVGAGYTGLWSAYYLKQREPGSAHRRLRSGARRLRRQRTQRRLVHRHGVRRASRCCDDPATRSRGVTLARALFDTVDEVGRVCQAENIDAHYAKGGTLNVATIPFQVPYAEAPPRAAVSRGLQRSGLPLAARAESRARLAMTPNHGALYFRHCAAVHPARLVLGLADVVRRQGTRIHEGTPVHAIESGRIVDATRQRERRRDRPRDRGLHRHASRANGAV